jgi:hypothetical protein
MLQIRFLPRKHGDYFCEYLRQGKRCCHLLTLEGNNYRFSSTKAINYRHENMPGLNALFSKLNSASKGLNILTIPFFSNAFTFT